MIPAGRLPLLRLNLALTPVVQRALAVLGGVWVSPRRKLLAAIGIGVVLAGPPVAALNIWLSGLAERQGREELDLTARRHMAMSEARLVRAVSTLDDLAARGIDSCRVSNVDAMRQTTF